MRHVTERGIDLIKQFEELKLTPYLCPAGYWTIGYGHLLGEKSDERYWGIITEATAEALLVRDVHAAERAVLRLIRVPLADAQYDALVSFTFNLGGGALQRSRLRACVNREEHGQVPVEFMRWTFARGKQLPGLIKRRRVEAVLYASG